MKDQLFFTAADKKRELQILDILKGDGNIDAVMVPWIDRLNKLPGIYTGASCGGHRANENKNYCYVDKGYIVLCLTKGSFVKLFQKDVGKLSSRDSFSSQYRFDDGVSCALDFAGGCCVFLCFDTTSNNDTTNIMDKITARLEHFLLPPKNYVSKYR